MERMRRNFSVDKRHVEVPESRSLAPEVQNITEVVCKYYNVDKDALTVTRRGVANEPRNVAIYLMRHLRGDSFQEIGREFYLSTYGSVSSVVERIKTVITKDGKLRQRVV